MLCESLHPFSENNLPHRPGLFFFEVKPGIISQIQIFPRFHKIADLADVIREVLYDMDQYARPGFLKPLNEIPFSNICLGKPIQDRFDLGGKGIQ